MDESTFDGKFSGTAASYVGCTSLSASSGSLPQARGKEDNSVSPVCKRKLSAEHCTSTARSMHLQPAKTRSPLIVHDDFKLVDDQGCRRNKLKVVPPYWHTFETDVKMRWRDREILSVLTSEFRSRPTSYYQQAIESRKHVLLNGQPCTCETVLRNGDHITHNTIEVEFALPALASVYILHEDDNLLAVFKPAGMPVHPQGRYTQGSLTGILKKFHLRRDSSAYLHPINRLDRVTAGVVVLAKTPSMSRTLTDALPSALKLYIANVQGDFGAIVEQVRVAQQRVPPLGGASLRAFNLAEHGATPQQLTADSRERRDDLGQSGTQRAASPYSTEVPGDETRVLGNSEEKALFPVTLMDPPQLGSSQECDASCGSAEGVPSLAAERRRRKDQKRQQKLQKKTQQALHRQQRERELQEKVSRQTCLDERFTLEEATRRGIFSVTGLSFGPGPLKGSADSPGCQREANDRSESLQGKTRPQSFARTDPESSEWLRVTARLAVSDCLIGRQLAVTWNESYGKEAETLFQLLCYDPCTGTSLVACIPLTGRTHQIRKHLQILGCSILRDKLYACTSKPVRRMSPVSNLSLQEELRTPLLQPEEAPKSDERVPHFQDQTKNLRASVERSVLIDFSIDELRSANKACLGCSCPGCSRPLTNLTIVPEKQRRVEAECLFVDRLREAAPLTNFVVSEDGRSVKVPYIVEEPLEIHLMSAAYLFDLSRGFPSVPEGTTSAASSNLRQPTVCGEVQQEAESGDPCQATTPPDEGCSHPGPGGSTKVNAATVTSDGTVLP
ncbi:rna pseudouridine synthase superfamily protein, partial [Cystoisospora suis]